MSAEEPFLYDDIDRIQQWATAVPLAPQAVDAHGPTRFRLPDGAKIAVLGDEYCAALVPALLRAGVGIQISETGPPWLSAEEKARFHYGLQSARCGWMPTAPAIAQAFDRVARSQPFESAWWGKDGRIYDAYRPDVQPEGYESVDEAVADSAGHQSALKRMLVESDALLLALGATEAWARRRDGAVLGASPLAFPDVNREPYHYVNFDVAQTLAALRGIAAAARSYNPRLKFIAAVVPRPAAATLEPIHALHADRLAKSTLVCAIDAWRREDQAVEYFALLEAHDATGRTGTARARQIDAVFVAAAAEIFARRFGAFGAFVEPAAASVAYERRLCDEDELRAIMAKEFED